MTIDLNTLQTKQEALDDVAKTANDTFSYSVYPTPPAIRRKWEKRNFEVRLYAHPSKAEDWGCIVMYTNRYFENKEDAQRLFDKQSKKSGHGSVFLIELKKDFSIDFCDRIELDFCRYE